MARPSSYARLCVAALLLLALGSLAGCGTPALDHRTSGDPRAGLSIFKFEGCAECHAISGVSVGTSGPALDGEGSRRAAPWLRRLLPRHIKATRLPVLTPRDDEDLVSYLTSLR